MDFELSAELTQLKDTARSVLAEHSPTTSTRDVLDGGAHYDASLWARVAQLGWLSATIPEDYGGIGLGHLATCVLAEEIGYAISPIPFSSSVYLATEAIVQYGSDQQKRDYLPKLAVGEQVGTLAFIEANGPFDPKTLSTWAIGDRVSGRKLVVPDGLAADFVIVAVQAQANEPSLFLVDLPTTGVEQTPGVSVDPARGTSTISFTHASATPLPQALGSEAVAQILIRAAAVMSFEQLGVAQAALDMACSYAKERFAFGRAIGSFQAIKHKLVDVYVAIELARSNCYFAGWALENDAPELAVAAAASRVSACDAGWLATKENIQTHGGMGFTWLLDCHLYYRRAKALGLVLGSAREWKLRLMDSIQAIDGAGSNIAFATGEKA